MEPSVFLTITDELRREIVTFATAPGADSLTVQYSYEPDFSVVFDEETVDGDRFEKSHGYYKPGAILRVRVKSTFGNEESDWTTYSLKVPYPTWGLAKFDGVYQKAVVDIVKIRNGVVSPRGWIDGEYRGENRVLTR